MTVLAVPVAVALVIGLAAGFWVFAVLARWPVGRTSAFPNRWAALERLAWSACVGACLVAGMAWWGWVAGNRLGGAQCRASLPALASWEQAVALQLEYARTLNALLARPPVEQTRGGYAGQVLMEGDVNLH